MNSLLKAACLAVYLVAVIGSLGVLPATVASAAQQVAVILLALHWLPLAKAMKHAADVGAAPANVTPSRRD